MANQAQSNNHENISFWTRINAYSWYIWGLSLCHWGIRTTEQSFYQSGVNSFTRALNIWPQFAQCYYRRGVIRGRELREYQQGIADLTKAINLEPEWAEPYLQRGLLQRFHGNRQAAIEDLQRYLELGVDASSTWRNEAQQQIIMAQTELDE